MAAFVSSEGRQPTPAACDDLLVERPFMSRYQTALPSMQLISQKQSFRKKLQKVVHVVLYSLNIVVGLGKNTA